MISCSCYSGALFTPIVSNCSTKVTRCIGAELVSVGRYEALCVAQGGFISRTRPYKVELKLGGFGRFSRRVKVGQQMILGYGNKHSGAVQATFVQFAG